MLLSLTNRCGSVGTFSSRRLSRSQQGSGDEDGCAGTWQARDGVRPMSQTGVHFLKSACAVAMFALPRLTDVVKDRCHARKVPTTHLSIATIHCYSINSSVPATGPLLRQRVWTYLDMHGARFRTLAALHHPWHARSSPTCTFIRVDLGRAVPTKPIR